MTAHVKKIGSDPDRMNLKQLLPNLTSSDLEGISRRFNWDFAGDCCELGLDDNAFRSILPLGVNGILSMTAKAAGIM